MSSITQARKPAAKVVEDLIGMVEEVEELKR
jgi:hypothetical protein